MAAAGDEARLRRRQCWRRRWQEGGAGQGSAQVVAGQAQFAGMAGKPAIVSRHMPDGMGPRRHLGEDEGKDEEEMAERFHRVSLRQGDEKSMTGAAV